MKTLNNGNEAPKAVTITRHLGVPVLTLNYNLKETENGFEWDSVTLQPGVQDYASIVAAIVNNEYGPDAMQAIINNYLLEPDDPEIIEEWNTMQAFRAYAKQIARDFIAGNLAESLAVAAV